MSPSFPRSRAHGLRAWTAAAAMGLLLAPPASIAEPTDSTPSASPTVSEEPGTPQAAVGDQIVDAVVLRPLGALALVGGAISFVVTSPLVLVSRVIDYRTSWDVMVVAPWEYTVERPLGDL